MIADSSSELLVPDHTKHTLKVAFGLLFYSTLMFTLPFGAFFGTESLLKHYFHMDGFATVAWSVFSVVITVNAIILAYAYKAYHESNDNNEDEDDSNFKQD